MVNKILFSIDGDEENDVFEAVAIAGRWNGWLVPMVDKANHQKIIAWYGRDVDRLRPDDYQEAMEYLDEMKNLKPRNNGLYVHNTGLCWYEITDCKTVFESAGFELWNTGGGCTAYGLELANGNYILVTHGGTAECPERPSDICSVYMYTDFDGYDAVMLGDGMTALEVARIYSQEAWQALRAGNGRQ